MGTTGKCIIISASQRWERPPSSAACSNRLRLAFSVSATSRAKRNYEVDGQDYFFITAEVSSRSGSNGMSSLSSGKRSIQGSNYGTLRSEIDVLANGNSAIFDVWMWSEDDLKKYFGYRKAIFISPPSVAALEQRLLSRGTESAESLRKRVDKAAHEMTFASQFDAIVVNDTLEHAREEAHARRSPDS